jgi:hypothetical protein
MYLNSSSKNYEKKYKKYKDKYQMLKSHLNGALLYGGAQGTLLNGGDCYPLPNPEDDDIISAENLLNLHPDERITILNNCYDLNSLYRWIVIQNNKILPATQTEITYGDRQRLIQAYNALPQHLKKSYPAPDFFESDDVPSEYFYEVSDDDDDWWRDIPPQSPRTPLPPPSPLQYKLHEYCRRYFSNIPINEIIDIDNRGRIDNLKITENCLQGFDNLRTINLRYDNLSILFEGDNDFITSNTLVTFVLQTNLMRNDPNHSNEFNLNTIWPRMFVNLNSLRSIDLSFNIINDICRDSFINLPVLKELNLSNNKISEIPEDLFQNLPTLEKINLGNNQISNLPKDLFQNLPNLTNIALDFNEISNLPKDLFQNLPNLTDIVLDYNEISIIPNKYFKNLRKLKNLSLTHNQITTIYMDTFINLPVINIIRLVGNRITTIQPHSFVNLNPSGLVILMNSTLSESNKSNIGYSNM